MEVNRQDAKSAKGEILPAEWINRYGRHERNEETGLPPKDQAPRNGYAYYRWVQLHDALD